MEPDKNLNLDTLTIPKGSQGLSPNKATKTCRPGTGKVDRDASARFNSQRTESLDLKVRPVQNFSLKSSKNCMTHLHHMDKFSSLKTKIPEFYSKLDSQKNPSVLNSILDSHKQ